MPHLQKNLCRFNIAGSQILPSWLKLLRINQKILIALMRGRDPPRDKFRTAAEYETQPLARSRLGNVRSADA